MLKSHLHIAVINYILTSRSVPGRKAMLSLTRYVITNQICNKNEQQCKQFFFHVAKISFAYCGWHFWLCESQFKGFWSGFWLGDLHFGILNWFRWIAHLPITIKNMLQAPTLITCKNKRPKLDISKTSTTELSMCQHLNGQFFF